MIDAIRKSHPDAPIYTFWDYKRNRWQTYQRLAEEVHIIGRVVWTSRRL